VPSEIVRTAKRSAAGSKSGSEFHSEAGAYAYAFTLMGPIARIAVFELTAKENILIDGIVGTQASRKATAVLARLTTVSLVALGAYSGRHSGPP